MKDWQFWLLIAGLLQIHYDLKESVLTLVLAWLTAIMSLYCSWKGRYHD